MGVGSLRVLPGLVALGCSFPFGHDAASAVESADVERPRSVEDDADPPAPASPEEPGVFADLDPLADLTEETAEGFRMPGEHEEIDRVLIGWENGNWEYVQIFADLARLVTEEVPLTVVGAADDTESFRDYLEASGIPAARLSLIDTPLNSMWIRDYGPVYVRGPDGDLAVVDLPYHEDRLGDDDMPSQVAATEHRRLLPVKLPIEGGHLLSDGQGRCIVSADVLYFARQEGVDRDTVIRRLQRAFGCDQPSFVDPLIGEETGHVDVFAAIPGPGRALIGRYRELDDPVNRQVLDGVAAQLRREGFEVERIPMPANRGRRLFRTYTNVLVLNHSVLVPVYDAARHFEAQALGQIETAFGRRAVPIDAERMMELAGAIHCITRTVPVSPRTARAQVPTDGPRGAPPPGAVPVRALAPPRQRPG